MKKALLFIGLLSAPVFAMDFGTFGADGYSNDLVGDTARYIDFCKACEAVESTSTSTGGSGQSAPDTAPAEAPDTTPSE